MKRRFPESELIINADGSCFHLHIRPEQLADRIVLVSDPSSVNLVATYFDSKECEIESREFHTITGTYRGKRITCISYGFGSEDIDIVINELDTLANIDYHTREENDTHRTLTMVNIGISEGVQPQIESGTIIASNKAIGIDGLLNYYAGRNKVCDLKIEKYFINHLQWNPIKGAPYVVTTDNDLLNQMAKEDVTRGYTVSYVGFYAPQGRALRHQLEFANMKEYLSSFEYDGDRIFNIDMETASIIGLASLLGHRAISCCIVDDVKQNSFLDKNEAFDSLIQLVLERI